MKTKHTDPVGSVKELRGRLQPISPLVGEIIGSKRRHLKFIGDHPQSRHSIG